MDFIFNFGSLFEKIFNFLTGQLGGLDGIIDHALEYAHLEDTGIPGAIDCLSATINLFLPVRVIIWCFTCQIPLFIASTGIKLLLRVKSFIPTMGH